MSLCESWATTADLCEPCSDYALDAGLMDDFLTSASETLFILSGQQFPGECTVESYRPCSSGGGGGGVPYRMTAFAPFPNISACTCGSYDTCGCPSLSQITLPFPHVNEVTKVKVDGNTLSSTDYRLDSNSLLVSTTTTRWPCCQDLRKADTEEGTWSVSLTYGRPVPLLGVRAAAILACEFYVACNPDAFEGECRLPSNWTSVARQGVTVARLIGETFYPKPNVPIRFGIPEIDLFLSTYSSAGVTSPMVFLSPDDPDLGRVIG